MSARVLGLARAAALAILAASCAHRPGAPPPSAEAVGARGEAQARQGAAGVRFVEDDYGRALARAKAEDKPLVVEAWAPWCHTCAYMRRFVFPDPSLAPVASRFVWAAIDTEKDANRDVLARYPVQAWPTMWVVDPRSETVVLTWIGSATVPELKALLDDAQESIARGPSARDAAAELASIPRESPRRPFAVSALSDRLKKSDPAACVELAAAEAPRMPAGTPLANVLGNALDVAGDLPKTSPARDKLPALVAEAKRVVLDASLGVLADDRSSLYETLVEALASQGDTAGANEMARAWSAFLESEAARAPTPEARAVFDAHRLSAYLYLGQEAKAIEMLAQSERDFPSDYNPPARLARAYLKLRQYDLALAAIDRALSRIYGPRAMRVLELKADVLEAKGDRAGAIAALREAMDVSGKVALPGSYAKGRDELRARLESLEKKQK